MQHDNHLRGTAIVVDKALDSSFLSDAFHALLSTWRATVQECRTVIQSDLNLTLFALLTYDYLTANNSFCNTRRARSRNLSLINVHHREFISRRIIWDDDCRFMRLLREEKKARISSSRSSDSTERYPPKFPREM